MLSGESRISSGPFCLQVNTSLPSAGQKLENPPFSLYMGRPPTEVHALRETAPNGKIMNMEPTVRVRLAKDVLMQKVGDDAILLNLDTENYFALDEIALSSKLLRCRAAV